VTTTDVRTLFLGDSHSAGYVLRNDTAEYWTDNNYAEIYSANNNASSVIYALPGGSNKKYPVWVSYLLDHYTADKIFIQSTYWNRSVVAASPDYGERLKKDQFVKRFEDGHNGKIHRYTDMFFNDDHFELMFGTYHNIWTDFEGFRFDFDDPHAHEFIFEKSYKYTKMWHEELTHLQLRQYLSDLIVIDHMLTDIPVYVWNINNRVHMPTNINLFGKFKNIKFAPMSAEEFLLKTEKMKIEKMQIDGEHYNKEVHQAIAEKYLPYLESL
jgi:hypothetical protein